MKSVRILVSSPEDVREERERTRGVVQQLRRRFAGRLDLQTILWEDLPLQADMSFQDGIDVVLSNKGVDIAIFILWSRLGSPTGPLLMDKNSTAFRSGTEREWHLMLEARQDAIARGEPPRPNLFVYTRHDECSFEERLRGIHDEEKVELIAQKKLLKQFIQEEFSDAETGVNIRAYRTFDHPTEFTKQLRTHLTAVLESMVDENASTPQWQIQEHGMPYRGLEVFEFEHAPVFFGREDEIVSVRMRLREHASNGCAFVLIGGASGSGKSSLARAGVLPEIYNYEIDESVGQWRRVIVKPSELGPRLVEGLVNKFMEPDALPELAAWRNDILLTETEPDPIAWKTRFKLRILDALKLASQSGKNCRLILLVDQLEELFSAGAYTKEVRETFCETLELLAKTGLVWIIATIRTDHYHHCQSVEALMRMLAGKGIFDLVPPTPDALSRIITGPATLAGLQFEVVDHGSLADLILREAIDHKELLPLLEHVLLELCEHRSPDGKLLFSEFRRVGGVQGALIQRCEEAYSQNSPNAQHRLGNVLAQLITLSGAQEIVVRRTVPLKVFEADEPSLALVKRFTEARLFSSSANSEGDSVVSVAHEALIRIWPRAQQWIAENREYLRLRATIEPSCSRWLHLNEEHSLLLPSGLPLEEGRRFLRLEQSASDRDLTNYIQRSIRADASRRRRKNLLVGSGVLLLVLISAVTVWSMSSSRAAALASVKALTLAQKATQDQLVTAKAERLALQSREALSQSTSLALLLAVHAAESLTDQDLPILTSVQQSLINALDTTNYQRVKIPDGWSHERFTLDGRAAIVANNSRQFGDAFVPSSFGLYDLTNPSVGVVELGSADAVHVGNKYFILQNKRELRIYSIENPMPLVLPTPDDSPIYLTEQDLLITAHANQLRVWDVPSLINGRVNRLMSKPLASGPLAGGIFGITANSSASVIGVRVRDASDQLRCLVFRVKNGEIRSLKMAEEVRENGFRFSISQDGRLLHIDAHDGGIFAIDDNAVNRVDTTASTAARLLDAGRIVFDQADQSSLLLDAQATPMLVLREYDLEDVFVPGQSPNAFILGIGDVGYRLIDFDANQLVSRLHFRMPDEVDTSVMLDETDVFFHLDEKKSLLSTVAKDEVFQWDIARSNNNVQRVTLNCQDDPKLVQPVGRQCLVGHNHEIYIWNPVDNSKVKVATAEKQFTSIHSSRDGTKVVAIDKDSHLRRWSLDQAAQELEPWELSFAAIALSPDGSTIHAIDENSNFTSRSFADPAKVVASIPLPNHEFPFKHSYRLRAHSSSSGRFLAIFDEKTLMLLDLEEARIVYSTTDSFNSLGDVAFIDSDQRFVHGSEIVDTRSGTTTEVPSSLYGKHWAFTDQKRVLTQGNISGDDRSAMIWSSETKNDERLPILRADPIDAVAMSHNGLLMAASQLDCIRMWKLTDTGTEAQAISLPIGDTLKLSSTPYFEKLIFSADDSRLYAIAGEQITSWNMDFRELCRHAREFVKRDLTDAEKTLYLENASVSDVPPTTGGMF